MQNEKEIIQENKSGKTYISNYNKEKSKQINIFFDENENTNVMENVIKTLTDIYAEKILKDRKLL